VSSSSGFPIVTVTSYVSLTWPKLLVLDQIHTVVFVREQVVLSQS